MNIKIWTLALLVCGTVSFVYSYSFSISSHESYIFETLRPKHSPKNITIECETVVTEPYGLLKKTYKRGEVKGSNCSWTLRAPADHVISMIWMGFDLTDDISSKKHNEEFSGSYINFYDSDQKYLSG